MYEVNCSIYGVCGDGSIGNIKQGNDVFYTDEKLENIETTINQYLITKKKAAVIDNVKKISGTVLKRKENDKNV